MSAMAMGGCDSLWSALAAVRDHRRGAGRRYPLPGLLLIAVAALLAGRRDQLGIVRWGRGLSVSALASLGLTRGRVPAPSVWCELFQGLDVASLEAALGAWVRGGRAPGHIAIDGKRLRGSATATAPGVHLLTAFSDALSGVIGQLQLAPDSNEITAALELLKALPLTGGVVTGDAIFTQKEICRVIRDRGGAYFFTVKDNQPALKADIALAFGDDSPLGRMVAATWPGVHRNGRQGARPDRDPHAAGHLELGRLSLPRVAGPGANLPHHSPSRGARPGEHRDGVCDHQLDG